MGGQLSVNVRIPIRLGSRLLNDVTDRQTNIIVLPRLFDGEDPSANAAGKYLIAHKVPKARPPL